MSGDETVKARTRPADGRRLFRVVVLVALNWAALGATILLVPDIAADSAWSVLLAAVVLGLLGAVLRPPMVALMTRVGWAGVVLGWLLTQALLVYLALAVTPGVRVDSFWSAFWASWLYGAMVSIGLWFLTAGDLSVLARHLERVNRRHRAAAPTTAVPGLVVIQVDGLSAPLAWWGIWTGSMPTLGRWLRSGSHTLVEWHAQLPATTPASQAGLLHGASREVPAFRWYEKETGRLVVTNRPRDSAMVEARMSNGRGLLADGGVSVSNVFSGGASTSLLTMSTVGGRRTLARPTRFLTSYLLDPFGLSHSLVLMAGEIVKELLQARRQRLRQVEPRTPRTASYVALRGLTNVLLRHLNLSIIAEHMMRGTPAIFCDFVDYDEIAHHAGPGRPEAMAALEGVDGVLITLERLAAVASRPYHVVVVSDHGQSQGATFRQRYGYGLDDLVERLTAVNTAKVMATEADERQGRAHTLRLELAGKSEEATAPTDAHPVAARIVVVASGNLGMVYLADQPGRLTMEEVEAIHPRLLTGLVGHPGVGWVMVRSRDRGPIVLGPSGRRFLDDGTVDGDDPLEPFGPHAVDDLCRHDGLPHVGDLVVNSVLDVDTDEVAAFEELTGSHGGLGGWQNRPLLAYPAKWPIAAELVGADAVHEQLLAWRERLGRSRQEADRDVEPRPAPDPTAATAAADPAAAVRPRPAAGPR
jgi:uncharacterized membrane protein YvlD (DUF360 family)